MNIQEIIEKLKASYGFEENARGDLFYGTGSIANYVKITLYKPRMMYSVETDSPAMAFAIDYEDFSEPGYLEIDHKTSIQCNVKVENIFAWLEKKGIRSKEYWDAKRKERRKVLAARFK